MPRGDDVTFSVAVTSSGTPVDLESTQSITFTAKRRMSDPDSAAILSKTVGAGIEVEDNVAQVTIDRADTQDFDDTVRLFWDVEVIDAEGLVHTVASGRLWVRADVTRSLPS